VKQPRDEAQSGDGLGALLRARRDEIVAEWVRRARALPAARGLEEPALRDYIPGILDRISRALERPGPEEEAEVDDLASEHALERLAEGYDVASAAAEFVALRETVLDLCETVRAGPLAPDEVRGLNRAIDEAIVASVARFTRAHERTLVALDRVASAALGTGETDQFLPRLLDVMLETTAAAHVALIFLRGEDDVLRVRASTGDDGKLGSLAVRMGEKFSGAIAARGEPALTRDASTDANVSEPLRAIGIHALYGVSLVHEGRVIGVAEMASRSAYDFSREDLSRQRRHRGLLPRCLGPQADRAAPPRERGAPAGAAGRAAPHLRAHAGHDRRGRPRWIAEAREPRVRADPGLLRGGAPLTSVAGARSPRRSPHDVAGAGAAVARVDDGAVPEPLSHEERGVPVAPGTPTATSSHGP